MNIDVYHFKIFPSCVNRMFWATHRGHDGQTAKRHSYPGRCRVEKQFCNILYTGLKEDLLEMVTRPPSFGFRSPFAGSPSSHSSPAVAKVTVSHRSGLLVAFRRKHCVRIVYLEPK